MATLGSSSEDTLIGEFGSPTTPVLSSRLNVIDCDPRNQLPLQPVLPEFACVNGFVHLRTAALYWFGTVEVCNKWWIKHRRVLVISDEHLYLSLLTSSVSRCSALRNIDKLILDGLWFNLVFRDECALRFRLITGSYDDMLKVLVTAYDLHSAIPLKVEHLPPDEKIRHLINLRKPKMRTLVVHQPRSKNSLSAFSRKTVTSSSGRRVMNNDNEDCTVTFDMSMVDPREEASVLQTMKQSSAAKFERMASGTYAEDENDRMDDWMASTPDAERGPHFAELQNFRGHDDIVTSVSFSDPPTHFCSSSRDGTVKVWLVDSGEVTHTFQHDAVVLFCVFSPIDEVVLSASGQSFNIWNIPSDMKQATVHAHSADVNCLSLCRTSSHIASCSDDGSAKIWAPGGVSLVATLKDHTSAITCVTFGPNPSLLGTASKDGTAKVWHWRSQIVIHTLTGHSQAVTSISFSPVDTCLATGSEDGLVIIWKCTVDGDTQMQSLKGYGGCCRAACFTDDGRRIFAAMDDHTAKLWWRAPGQLVSSLHGHEGKVLHCCVSGNFLLTCGGTQVKLWDIGKILEA
eukprot:NODE_147_length_2187_cov_275.756782_g120_i0.p1 GENE.NODE_147_length_2187_cov_275.756782_g120_i0~~NODE_147_length_2187_cov_275.756782_g120_i0.p1  ORF type:complete len:571 (+),score=100.06 NODE_147_length_2187_cov_275.756782_g120_i0:55-1767(+)